MLTKEEILHIASLARIGLKEGDVENYQKDLSAVLDYFEELKKLKTDDVEPIGHITGTKNSTRSDERFDAGELTKEGILKNAPELRDGYVKVRSVL